MILSRLIRLGPATAAAVLFAVTTAGRAEATPILVLSDGTTTITITDGGVGDTQPLAGVVGYSGAVGSNWIINASTGLTYPVVGTTDAPQMDLNSINYSLGAGTLFLTFWADGFNYGAGFTMNIGGVVNSAAGSGLAYSTYSDGSLIGTLLFGPGVFAGSGSFASPGPTSALLQSVTITHGAAGATSFNGELLPEPSLLALFGAGLFGAGARLRRRHP